MSGCLAKYGGLATGRENEQRRYFSEQRLYTLQVESTDACPQACAYCYAQSGAVETRALTVTEILGLLDSAARLDVRAIDWLGGDPLARRDWHGLMDYARGLGLTNNVWTSGLPLRDADTARMVADVTEHGFVSVHADSVSPDVYARLHPHSDPRNIAAIIEGVDHLQRAGKSPDQMINCITFTAAQPPDDVVETMRWWWREKGMRTCLTMFNPAGMGPEWTRFVPSAEATRMVFRERDLLNYGPGDGSIAAMDTDKFYCGTMATVTFTGDVTPCSVIREGVANIRKTPFERIIREHLGSLVHASLHDTRRAPAPCNECAENEHCWGCRASAYHYAGNAEGVDPKCWRVATAPAAGTRIPLRIVGHGGVS